MRKLQSKILTTAATLLTLAAATPSHADTLMVISDSGGMFGDKSLNQAMEHFGAGLAISAMKKNYRRVVELYGADGLQPRTPKALDWARKVVETQEPGEKIDVFAMQHSGNSFLSIGGPQVVEAIFPKGMVRRVFSSGCSNWGDFTANADGSDLKIQSQGDFNEHLKRLGVEEYIIHANMNGTGPFTYPLLASEMSTGGSWIEAGKRAFDKSDLIASSEYFHLKKLEGPLHHTGVLSSGSYASSLMDVFFQFFESRPVFGGSLFGEKKGIFTGTNMLTSLTDPNYAQNEAMLAPGAALTEIFKQDLPFVFDPSILYGNHDAIQSNFAKDADSLSDGVMGIADLLKQLLGEVARTPREDEVCVDPKPFQAFLDTYTVTEDGKIPQFEKICMEKVSAKEYTLSWKLNTPSGLHFPGLGVWLVKIPEGINTSGLGVKLKTLYLRRHGSLTFVTDGNRTGINLKGIGVRAEGPHLAKYFKVPNGVMRFTVRSASMTEKGEFEATLGTVLGPIVNVEGKLNNSGAEVDTLRVLGIPFKIKM